MKKVSVYFILQIIIICFLFSCKKKEPAKIDTNNNQPFVEPTKVNGIFSTAKYLYFIDDTVKVEYGLYNAVIYNDSLHNLNTYVYDGIDGGNISLNNVVLKKNININTQPVNYEYRDTMLNVIEKPSNWVISGSSNFNFLHFTDYTPYPTYTGYNNLPDTIDLNKNNVINITNYTGADKLEVSIMGGWYYSTTKVLLPSENTVTFSPDDLVGLYSNPNQFVNIKIVFYKNTFKYVGNKVFQMQTPIFFNSRKIHFKI